MKQDALIFFKSFFRSDTIQILVRKYENFSKEIYYIINRIDLSAESMTTYDMRTEGETSRLKILYENLKCVNFENKLEFNKLIIEVIIHHTPYTELSKFQQIEFDKAANVYPFENSKYFDDLTIFELEECINNIMLYNQTTNIVSSYNLEMIYQKVESLKDVITFKKQALSENTKENTKDNTE